MVRINCIYHQIDFNICLPHFPLTPLRKIICALNYLTFCRQYPIIIILYLDLNQQHTYNCMSISRDSRLYRKKQSFQIVGKLNYHEQLKVATNENRLLDQDNRKVLIIYTGGTIGMFKDKDGKFAPKKGQFKNFLQTYPYFSDQSQTYFIGSDGFTISPETIFRKKIWYKFYEMDKLIDSTDINIAKMNQILELIEKNYEDFDAFIVIHGTDTMSFTASSLSFMIQNLKKTIILTGSQVPMGQTRNDGVNNLLCALTIAGHYQIPEVLVVFDNLIMRGNRTTKSSASSFRAFTSPNYYPIGKLGLKIDIKWELVRSCKKDKPTKFTKLSPSTNVSILKLTPFAIPSQIKTKYLVVESYGTGNIPTEGPFYDWFKQNSEKNAEQRIIIVNISQVHQSVILNIYATGQMANKLGLIPGGDMTCEAAVAKLSYLATRNLSYQEIKIFISNNMRGELTESEDRHAMKKQNYVVSCSRMLDKNFMNQSQNFQQIVLYNVITKMIIERSSCQSLEQLCSQNQINFGYTFPDGSTLLHQYFKSIREGVDSIPYLQFLLNKQLIDINARDDNQCTALFYALQNNHINEASVLTDYEGEVGTSSRRVFRAIRNSQLTLLQLMCDFGDPLLYTNKQNRGVFSYAAIIDNEKVFQLLKSNLPHREDKVYLTQKDIYGKTAKEYIDMKNWEIY